MGYLTTRSGRWSLRDKPKRPDFGRSESTYLNLGKASPQGIKVQIRYRSQHERLWQSDSSFDDDRLDIELANTVDLPGFVHDFLPGLLEAFGCYRCDLYAKSLLAYAEANSDDPRLALPRRDHNPRRWVDRVCRVNFWDALLCERAWEATPAEMARRLTGQVEYVREVAGGVLSCLSTRPLTVDEELDVARRARFAAIAFDCIP